MKSLFTIVTIILLSLSLYAEQRVEKLSLQLDWKYQFQYAGFIMAKERGYYKELGLDVSILEYKAGINVEDEVLLTRADFGISNTPVMVKSKALQPTVILASYLHRSPLVFVTHPSITSPTQLHKKKIMATEYEYYQSALSLLLNHFFVEGERVTHSFSIEEFKNAEVDAMSAFVSNEIYRLEQEGVKYNIIDPYEYGFEAQAMNLFCSYEFAKNSTQVVKKFLDASQKGWEFALAHKEQSIETIYSKYNKSKSKEELRFEADIIEELMLLERYKIGEVSQELLQRVYTQLLRTDKIQANQRSKVLTFEDILEGTDGDELFFTKEQKSYLAKKGAIRLCVESEWMPFEGLKDGKHIGMIAEYFALIKERSNIKIELIPTANLNESIEFIKSAKCDIIGRASPTKERLEFMNFTEPYMKSPLVLITKVDHTFVDDITDIRDKRVGITKGNEATEALKERYPNIEIVEVESIMDGLRRVESAKLYGYIDNLSVSASSIQRDFYGVLKVSGRLNRDDRLSIGSSKDEPLLNEIFSKVIKRIDSSEVRAILNRWITVKESLNVDYQLLWKISAAAALVLLLIAIYSYELVANNKKLKQLSREDALTKVGNRLKLNELLESSYQEGVSYKRAWGVILLDIDNFKHINDTYGHIFGDEILKKFSSILLQNIRKTDTLGRWGGEEFLIICPDINEENLLKVAEGLRKNIESDPSLKEKDITASFGVALYRESRDIEEILESADRALYRAKSEGKNRVCLDE